MAGISLSDSLTVIIGGSAAGFVSALTQASTATKNFISLEDQQSIRAQKYISDTAAQAAAAARLTLSQAKQAGGGGTGSDEQLASAAASKEAAVQLAALNLAQKDAVVSADAAEAAAAKEGSGFLGLGSSANGLKTALSGIATVAPAAVAALGVDLVYKGVSAYTSLGAQVLQVKSVIGGTAEQASELVAQFNSLGINTSALDKSVNSLAVSIASGKDKLNDYGIQVAKNADGTVNLYQTLDNLRQIYQATTDATERDTIANELKVRGLQNLIPFLAETSAQQSQIIATAQQSGNILSDTQVNQAKQLSIAMNEAGLAVKGLEVNLAEGLAPSLTAGLKIFEDLTSGLRDNRAEQAALAAVVTGLVVPGLLKMAASAGAPLISALGDAATGLVGLGAQAVAATQSFLGLGPASAASAAQVAAAQDEMLADMTALGASVTTTSTAAVAANEATAASLSTLAPAAAAAATGVVASEDAMLAAMVGLGTEAAASSEAVTASLSGLGAAAASTSGEVVAANSATSESMTALADTSVASGEAVAASGTTMAAAAGPIGLLVAAVVGVSVAFRNAGVDAKTFVSSITQGFSTNTTTGLAGVIDAESKQLASLQTQLDAAKKAKDAQAADPAFAKIGAIVSGNDTGAEQYANDKKKVDALTDSLTANKQALANVGQVANDLGLTVAQVFSEAASAQIPLSGSLSDIETKFKDDGLAVGDFGSKTSVAFRDSLAAVSAYLASLDQADKLQKAVVSDATAQQSLVSATQAETTAVTAHNQALTDQAKLIKDGIAGDTAYVSAEKSLESASNSYRSAMQSETTAQNDLSKARTAATVLDLADAASKITLAGDTTGKDRAAVETAQEKLDALQGSGTASQAEIATAQADVKDAQDQVTQSLIDQQKATLDLTTLQQKGTEQDPAVVAAEQKVTDAHNNTAQALEGVQAAQADVNTAVAGYPAVLAAAQAKVDSTAADIVTKQQDVYNATLTANSAALDLKASIDNTGGQAYDAVKAKLDLLAPSYAAVLTSATQLAQLSGSIAAEPGAAAANPAARGPSLSGPLGAPGGNAQPLQPVSGARALGGPVEAGATYMVGEKGPERLKMGSLSGQIIPNEKTVAAAAPATPTAPRSQPPASAPVRSLSASSAATATLSRPAASTVALGAPTPRSATPSRPGVSSGGLYLGGQVPRVSQPAAAGARAGGTAGGQTVNNNVTTGPITTGASANDIARAISWRLLTLPPPPAPSGNNG